MIYLSNQNDIFLLTIVTICFFGHLLAIFTCLISFYELRNSLTPIKETSLLDFPVQPQNLGPKAPQDSLNLTFQFEGPRKNFRPPQKYFGASWNRLKAPKRHCGAPSRVRQNTTKQMRGFANQIWSTAEQVGSSTERCWSFVKPLWSSAQLHAGTAEHHEANLELRGLVCFHKF